MEYEQNNLKKYIWSVKLPWVESIIGKDGKVH
jgi:hypothetical protein